MFTTKTIKVNPKKPFINQSYKYLIHHLKLYNDKFNLLNSFKVKACCIGDMFYNENYIDNNYIFLLIQVDSKFKFAIEELRECSFYIDDYIYPHKLYNLQMLVLELPKEETKIKFLQGRYSELLENDEIDKVYNKIITRNGIEYYNIAYDVIHKNERARLRFQKMLYDDFQTTVEIKESDNRELDYPPIEANEIFNYD
jgi:hypothetical protein